MKKCPFCAICETVIASNKHAFAILDKSPISPGHSLVISRRHASTIFDLPTADYAGCFELVREVKDLASREGKAQGFNIVVNCGNVAGQKVLHAHIHVVPRIRGSRISRSVGLWGRLSQGEAPSRSASAVAADSLTHGALESPPFRKERSLHP